MRRRPDHTRPPGPRRKLRFEGADLPRAVEEAAIAEAIAAGKLTRCEPCGSAPVDRYYPRGLKPSPVLEYRP